MKQIQITRTNNVVTFDTVAVDTTEFVFFTNLDPLEAHWPSMTTNQLGPAPSPNSNQAAVPIPKNWQNTDPPFTYTYNCLIPGHSSEHGIVVVSAPLAAAASTTLQPARVNVPIQPQQVVVGGVSPYQISGQLFTVVDAGGNVVRQGSGIGPGIYLTPSNNSTGIIVSGTPPVVGTYNFTFIVNDGAQHNLQQVQYSMIVSA